MKTFLKTAGAKFLAMAFLLIALLIAMLMPPGVCAQGIGTYVVPRVTPLFIGTVTNGQIITNAFYGTNFLNYSGFHRYGLIETLGSTNAGNFNSNCVVWSDSNSASGSGYSNAITGLNTAYTTTFPFVWTNTLSGVSTNTYFTNIDWMQADNVYSFRAKISTTSTNAAGFQLEIDQSITP